MLLSVRGLFLIGSFPRFFPIDVIHGCHQSPNTLIGPSKVFVVGGGKQGPEDRVNGKLIGDDLLELFIQCIPFFKNKFRAGLLQKRIHLLITIPLGIGKDNTFADIGTQIGSMNPDDRVPPVKEIIDGHIIIPGGDFLYPVPETFGVVDDGFHAQLPQKKRMQVINDFPVAGRSIGDIGHAERKPFPGGVTGISGLVQQAVGLFKVLWVKMDVR